MDYVEISNTEDRIIKFGLSEVERYKTGKDSILKEAHYVTCGLLFLQNVYQGR